jgi:hypothetical protein
MKKLLPFVFALMAIITFTGCDSSDEEVLQLISINAIEGKWRITDVTFEVYQNGDKIAGYEDQPDHIISFYGGTAAIEGEDDVYTYTIESKGDIDYLTMIRNNSRKSVFKISELNLEDMRWDRDETVTGHDGTPHREVESSVFKKIEK